MDPWQMDYEAAVEVEFAEDLTYSDLSELLDRLGERAHRVRADRSSWSGPMGDGIEVALVVAAALGIAGGAFVKTFAEELAKDAYAGFRKALIAVARRVKTNEYRRAQVAFKLEIGALSFYFDGSEGEEADAEAWTDEGLRARFAGAQKVVDQAPQVLLEQSLMDFIRSGGFDGEERYMLKDAGYDWDAGSGEWHPNESMNVIFARSKRDSGFE